jgi:glycosyltransferase involved in cell wall biosynthesis
MYGAEAMLLNLAGAQSGMGCDVTIGVFHNLRQPHLEVAEEARRRGLAVEVIPCNGRFDRRTLSAIRRFVRVHGIETVHTHGYKADLYGCLATRRLDAAFVATCHLWTGSSGSVRLYEALDAHVLRRARKVAGVSDAIAQALRDSGVPAARVATIYNGTDLSRYAGASATLRKDLGIGDRLLIGCVGRLEEQKGLEYFVRAAREVLAEFPDALFVVVGEGSLRRRIQDLISGLNLDESVKLLGERTDMPGVYASLDLFALGSIDEGMPMTILEALAARRPVVATRVGAVGRLVINEKTGLLVEARDIAALRDAMLRCLRDPAFAHELARNGEQHVRDSYSAEAMARNYLTLYESAQPDQGWVPRPSSSLGSVGRDAL